MTTTLPPVLRRAHVRRPLEETFEHFTDRIGAWWPLRTHGLFGADSATVAFTGGVLAETATDGRSAVWAEVIEWNPPGRVVLAWHPGGAASEATRVEITFTADANGTVIDVAHHGWEALGESAVERRAGYSGPSAWGAVLDHCCDLLDRLGDRPSALLDAAYDAFFAEAAGGGHGSPPDGEWTADQVVAHVAVNDGLLAGVCRSIVMGADPGVLDNTASNDAGLLDAYRASFGDRASFLADAARRSRVLRGLLDRLSAEQLAVPVHARLSDHGSIVLDAPMPVGMLLVQVHATRHLPGHTEQLRSLRQA